MGLPVWPAMTWEEGFAEGLRLGGLVCRSFGFAQDDGVEEGLRMGLAVWLGMTWRGRLG